MMDLSGVILSLKRSHFFNSSDNILFKSFKIDSLKDIVNSFGSNPSFKTRTIAH